MLRIFPQSYLALGERIQSARRLFKGLKNAEEEWRAAKAWKPPVPTSGLGNPSPIATLLVAPPQPPPDAKKCKDQVDWHQTTIKSELQAIHGFCAQLKLPISVELLDQKLKSIPKSVEEFDLLISATKAELKNLLFLFVPSHRSTFFEKKNLVSEGVSKHFPESALELRDAANCLAVGFYTAAVFHAMRAVEIGMKALAVSLGVKFDFPIEQADWANIIDQMESKIREMKNLARSAQKDSDQKFYSEAAMQFRYFKDGWRVRVSHARENYDESQAMGVMEHALSFFEIISARPLETP